MPALTIAAIGYIVSYGGYGWYIKSLRPVLYPLVSPEGVHRIYDDRILVKDVWWPETNPNTSADLQPGSDLRKELHVPGFFFGDGKYSGAVRVYFPAALRRIDRSQAELTLRVNGNLVAVQELREADISDEWLTYSVPLDGGILRLGKNTFDLSIVGGAMAVGGDQRLDCGRSYVWSADAWRKLDDIGELQVILERGARQ